MPNLNETRLKAHAGFSLSNLLFPWARREKLRLMQTIHANDISIASYSEVTGEIGEVIETNHFSTQLHYIKQDIEHDLAQLDAEFDERKK